MKRNSVIHRSGIQTNELVDEDDEHGGIWFEAFRDPEGKVDHDFDPVDPLRPGLEDIDEIWCAKCGAFARHPIHEQYQLVTV